MPASAQKNSEEQQSLLSPEERAVCEKIATAKEAPHSQRAQALLALDKGASQPEAGQQSGLKAGQVRYCVGKFRQQRLGLFPDHLAGDSQPKPLAPEAALEEVVVEKQPVEASEPEVEAEPEAVAVEPEPVEETQEIPQPVKGKKAKVKKAGKAEKAQAKELRAKKAKVDKKAKKKAKKLKETKLAKKIKNKIDQAKKAKAEKKAKKKKAKADKKAKKDKKGKK